MSLDYIPVWHRRKIFLDISHPIPESIIPQRDKLDLEEREHFFPYLPSTPEKPDHESGHSP